MSKSLSEVIKAFYGTDPLLGEDACRELVETWKEGAIEALIPISASQAGGSPHVGSSQIEDRLKQVALALGPRIIPHLVRAIETAGWGAKQAAAACFSGLSDSDAETPLIDVLKKGGDFDAERLAVEALGRLGAVGWSYELVKYSKSGTWNFDVTGLMGVSRYPFEKVSSYVLEALTRFTGSAADPAKAHMLCRQLTEYMRLMEDTLPQHGAGNTHRLVAQLGREFREGSVDAIIQQWGGSADERLQRLCAQVLRDAAPLRAAKYLLTTAVSAASSDSVRTDASIALGEIRVQQVAQRIADALKDPETDRTSLSWAFSTLYALPADWTGVSGYVDEVLSAGDAPACQLRYSLALKGDDRCRKELIDYLDHSQPYYRWTAALALARLLGTKSRPYLEHRAEDAGDDIERCAMYAAVIRAGDHDKAARLHAALCQSTRLRLLPSVWTLEILDAFGWPKHSTSGPFLFGCR